MLVYAANEDAPEHSFALRCLAEALEGQETVGFAWLTILGFLRVATHRRVLPNPFSVEEAHAAIAVWLTPSHTVLVEPSPRHLSLLRGLLAEVGTAGNLVPDAHLAALALEYDATVVSFDRDFGRFEGVRWRLPDRA